VKGHGSKFGRKKETAIAALLSQRNIEEAARATGVGTRTLYRWLDIPDFREEYLHARRQAFGQATARMQHASSTAVTLLLNVMIDKNAPASSRVRAAAFVLERAEKAFELDDLNARITRLERLQEEQTKWTTKS
jgi:transposase-like protein